MKQVVLLSGGLDSSINLCLALEAGEVILALTFDYGQLSAIREIAKARELCNLLKVAHRAIDLKGLKEWFRSAITDERVSLPQHSPEYWGSGGVDLEETAEMVWVPNRNGVMVNIAAAVAETVEAELVVAGFNAEEAETFPDNSREFVEAVNACWQYSTRGRVKLVSYTIDWDKKKIFKEGMRRDFPWKCLWACYNGQERMCGKCESCARLINAAREARGESCLAGLFGGE